MANKNGESLHRWWGYSKEMLFEELDLGFSDLTTTAEKEARYKNNPDAKTARLLASFYNTQGEIKKAATFFEDAAKYDPDNDYAMELFQIYSMGYRKNIYNLQEMQSVADRAVRSTEIDEDAKTGIYAQMTSIIKENPQDEKMLTFLSQGYEYLNKHENSAPKWAKDAINISYALYIEKNIEEAVKLKKLSYEDGWEDNPGDLNSFAWWCFENKINLDEARKFGQKGIKLAQPGREKAMILDTVAEIVNLDGSPKEAIVLMEQALTEDPENEYYQKQLERFRKLE